jgi:hypothetical protein
MIDTKIKLPLPYKVINALGNLFVAARLPSLRLDEATVNAAAMKQTGLADFGDPYYREGLQQLLESANADANLHPLGRFMTNDIVTNYLSQRLWLVETRKRQPEIFREPLRPPLIIAGLARSGTTFLHNLLALDPAHRSIPQWMLVRPFPEPHGDGDSPDPRIVKTEQGIRFRQPLLPNLDAIHYTRANSAEECILALGLTFNSLIFGTLLPVSGYQEWYLQQVDTFQKYREYRWLLQVFQSHKPEQRFVLKAPAHTGNLEGILQAIPGAMVIQTHRDPVTCICSVLSLLCTFYHAVTREIDLPKLTSLTLRTYESWFRRNLDFRAAHPGVIYDVYFDSFVSDPIGTVRGIYSHFGLPWPDAYESGLEDFIQKNPKNKHGKHRYAASDFGLTEAEIGDRLGFYSEHFGL